MDIHSDRWRDEKYRRIAFKIHAMAMFFFFRREKHYIFTTDYLTSWKFRILRLKIRKKILHVK